MFSKQVLIGLSLTAFLATIQPTMVYAAGPATAEHEVSLERTTANRIRQYEQLRPEYSKEAEAIRERYEEAMKASPEERAAKLEEARKQEEHFVKEHFNDVTTGKASELTEGFLKSIGAERNASVKAPVDSMSSAAAASSTSAPMQEVLDKVLARNVELYGATSQGKENQAYIGRTVDKMQMEGKSPEAIAKRLGLLLDALGTVAEHEAVTSTQASSAEGDHASPFKKGGRQTASQAESGHIDDVALEAFGNGNEGELNALIQAKKDGMSPEVKVGLGTLALVNLRFQRHIRKNMEEFFPGKTFANAGEKEDAIKAMARAQTHKWLAGEIADPTGNKLKDPLKEDELGKLCTVCPGASTCETAHK